MIMLSNCTDDNNDPNNGNDESDVVFNPSITYETVSDISGNTYKTVTIGTQTWMAENLKVTKYNDGSAIPNVANDVEWANLTTGAYRNYNDKDSTVATYGRLYNWYAINTGKLAPIGWHVATDAEWTTLVTYLGGQGVAGSKLKETGTTHWTFNDATNESGFTALPGGSHRGSFEGIGEIGYWWSATKTSETAVSTAYYSYMNTRFSKQIGRSILGCVDGLSVRCVKD